MYLYCLILRSFYYVSELFRQCGIYCFSIIFRNYFDSVVFIVFLLYFGTISTVWYLLFFYYISELLRQCGIYCFSIIFRNYFDSVVFIVFLLYFGTISTVWYLLFFYYISELFRQSGIYCFSFYNLFIFSCFQILVSCFTHTVLFIWIVIVVYCAL
jgi:hypothetical protein